MLADIRRTAMSGVCRDVMAAGVLLADEAVKKAKESTATSGYRHEFIDHYVTSGSMDGNFFPSIRPNRRAT